MLLMSVPTTPHIAGASFISKALLGYAINYPFKLAFNSLIFLCQENNYFAYKLL
jgi:hypothetical protein